MTPLAPELVAMLVCPATRAPLRLAGDRLICDRIAMAYPIEGGVPVLLVERATPADQASS